MPGLQRLWLPRWLELLNQKLGLRGRPRHPSWRQQDKLARCWPLQGHGDCWHCRGGWRVWCWRWSGQDRPQRPLSWQSGFPSKVLLWGNHGSLKHKHPVSHLLHFTLHHSAQIQSWRITELGGAKGLDFEESTTLHPLSSSFLPSSLPPFLPPFLPPSLPSSCAPAGETGREGEEPPGGKAYDWLQLPLLLLPLFLSFLPPH